MPNAQPPSTLSDGFLANAFAAGRAAWPALELVSGEFFPYLMERAERELLLGTPLESLQVADVYLCCACAKGDGRALQLLDERYLTPVVSRLRVSHAASDVGSGRRDDLLQATRERLLIGGEGTPRLLVYTGRVPLGAWIRVVALRIAINRLPRTAPMEALETRALEAEDGAPNPELDYLRTRRRESFSRAFADAVHALEPEEQVLLRLHYVDGLSIDHLGPLLGVHRATAARKLGRIREALLEQLRRAFREQLALTDSELDSVLNSTPSQLDVSLRQLLRA